MIIGDTEGEEERVSLWIVLLQCIQVVGIVIDVCLVCLLMDLYDCGDGEKIVH